MKEIKYNAEGKSLGRMSSDIARILMGKDDVDFAPNVVCDVRITVENLEKVKTDSRKMVSKKYYTHSGYIGNLKEKSMRELWDEDPQKFFISMVRRMLPNNKLTMQRLKKIKFEK